MSAGRRLDRPRLPTSLLLALIFAGTAGLPVVAAAEAGLPARSLVADRAHSGLCEHGVPADACTRCAPELAAVFKELGDWCEKHGLPLSHCRDCDPGLTFAPPPVVKPGTKVRFASAETAREAGIETAVARKRRLAQAVKVAGRIEFDQNRLAQIAARSESVIVAIHVDIGDPVSRGQPLLALASGDVGAEQARFAAAKVRFGTAGSALKREKQLAEKGIATRKSVEAARSELATARAELDAARAALDAAGAALDGAGGQFVLSSPIDGVVVARDALIGKSAAPDHPLLQIADLGTLWAILEVPESDAASVRPGQKVTLQIDGATVPRREAVVSRVAASVDPRTRTVRVRVDLPNADGSLKAGLLVDATIEIAGDHEAIVLPDEAVQYVDGQPIVFVQESEQVFVPTQVELGLTVASEIEVTRGVEAGSRVVTTGAFLCRTEIMKESIGAGCCNEEPK